MSALPHDDNGHRMHDPNTGRYASADPSGFNSSAKYYYANNNPEKINDIMGLCDDCEPNVEKYNNPTWTARLKLREENPFAKHLKLELCGLICRVRDVSGDVYFASENMIGTAGVCDPFTATCPNCSTSVAMWHIHVYVDANGDGANDYLSEVFSDQDFRVADAVGVDSHLATPTNRFLHYVAESGWKPIDRGIL